MNLEEYTLLHKSQVVVLAVALILGGLAALAAFNASAAPAQRSTANVQLFSDNSVVSGASSTITRTQSGVSMKLNTSGLEAGAAYTVWMVVFNAPANCSDGVCGEDDVLPPPGNVAAEVSVARVAGRVITPSGAANFGGRLNVGDMSEVLFGPGLTNPLDAEVHLIVRGHGDPIPSFIDDQIHTVGGGCEINVCNDDQFSMHLP